MSRAGTYETGGRKKRVDTNITNDSKPEEERGHGGSQKGPVKHPPKQHHGGNKKGWGK